MSERFVNALVRVLQIDVFADDRDLHAFLRTDDTLNKFAPVCEIRHRRFEVQQIADKFVEPFGVQHQRHFIDGMLDVARFDHRLLRNAAKH